MFDKAVEFYKQNLAFIVLLTILLFVFTWARQLPFINIIGQYYYYVGGIYLLLLAIYFRKIIESRKVFIAIEAIVLLTLILQLLFLNSVAESSVDPLGFVIFTSLLFATLVEFFSQRKELRDN